MKLHELSPVPGSNPKAYRKGRGNGSGNGKTGRPRTEGPVGPFRRRCPRGL